jgi:hypothetical protein
MIISSARTFLSRISLFAVLRGLFALHALMTYDQYYDRGPRFILFENPIFSSDVVFHLTRYAFYIALFLFILGIRVDWTGLFAGALNFLIIFMDFEERWAFCYLAPLGFIAFAIIAGKKRSGKTATDDAVPLILLICSIYLFASFHKAYNFSLMQANLIPMADFGFRDGLGALCSGARCEWIWRFVKWTAVPVEGAIGVLFFFAKTRRFAFLLATLFHLIIQTVFELDWVGIEMLMLVAIVATLQAQLNWTDIISKRSILLLVATPMATFGLAAFLGMTGYENNNILLPIYYFLMASYLFWPMIWLGAIGFFSGKSLAPKWRPADLVFASVLLLFGIVPILTNYTVPDIGWSMFSGVYEHQLYNSYFIQFHSPRCPLRPRYLLVAHPGPNTKGDMIYVSARKEFLEQLASYAKQICPETKMTGPSLVTDRPDLLPPALRPFE